MTRKDYELIARVLHAQRNDALNDEGTSWRADEIARAFADELAADNPRFDRARFLKACGVSS